MPSASAAEDAALDAVLEGFDEETSAEGSSLDSVMEGFDEAPASTAGPTTSPAQPLAQQHFQFAGSILLGSAYNFAHQQPAAGQTDYRGFSRLRLNGGLGLKARIAEGWMGVIKAHAFHDFIYELNDRDNYTSEVLEHYESEAEFDEVFLRGKVTPNLDIKLGRQIMVWGKSDNLRVTDILNPMDQRQLGQTDIEYLRLPVAMSRIDYYLGSWGLSAIAIHESRFDKRPVYGSDYYPLPTPPPQEIVPDNNGFDEYALALNGTFSGWDLSLYAAHLFEDAAHPEMVPGVGVRLLHSEIDMVGGAVNVALSNWLFKGEAAHFEGLRYSSLPGEEHSRSDLLVGIEYSGFSDTTLSLEIVDRYIDDYDNRLLNESLKAHNYETAFRYQGDFLHNQLHLTLMAVALGDGGDGGGFSRLALQYDLRDALELTVGVINYYEGDKTPFNAIADNDRIFVQLKQSF